jgi:hypothetical protein
VYKILLPKLIGSFGPAGMFGKSWGLKPMMTYWMYIVTVRPIVSYTALMWWPRIKEKVFVNKLT